MTTPLDFAKALLSALNVPVSTNNVAAIVAAEGIEGGHFINQARYNPLNTTQQMPGSYKAPGTIVQAYTSWQQGLDATVKTLRYAPYRGIIANLQADSPPDVTLADPGWRTWGWVGPISSASAYAAYGNHPDPIGGSLPFFSGGLSANMKAGLFAAAIIGGSVGLASLLRGKPIWR
jgi:hypothetical protein